MIAEGEVGVYASGGAAAVQARSVGGRGAELRSTQDYALYATTSNGFAAVWGRANINFNDSVGGTAQNGVYGQSYSTLGSGLFGRNESTGAGITAYSVGGLAGNFLGPITVGSCSGCAAPSDARLKRDIQPTMYALETVKALQPVSFSFFDERYGPGTHLGFLAQDVQSLVPELVSENSDGYLRVEYDGLIPVLVNAIQELQAEVDSLRSEVMALQSE